MWPGLDEGDQGKPWPWMASVLLGVPGSKLGVCTQVSQLHLQALLPWGQPGVMHGARILLCDMQVIWSVLFSLSPNNGKNHSFLSEDFMRIKQVILLNYLNTLTVSTLIDSLLWCNQLTCMCWVSMRDKRTWAPVHTAGSHGNRTRVRGLWGCGSTISCPPVKVRTEDSHVPCTKALASPHPSTLFLLVVSGEVPWDV